MAHPKRRGGSSKVMSRMQQSQVLVELEAWMECQPFLYFSFFVFIFCLMFSSMGLFGFYEGVDHRLVPSQSNRDQ